ncbi:MAG: adenine phosphoribosyltransferase [Pseudomonadota bacterium]
MSDLVARLEATIRDIPDFPKPGILFKDITPILSDPVLMGELIARMGAPWLEAGIDVVVGMESRGFLFGTPLALGLNAAFVPARKPGKLPYESIGFEYDLEYGTNRLEMHVDAITPGQRVLVVDDLLATGGTAAATCKLVEKLGGEVVACCFVVELGFLNGREKLAGVQIDSVVVY